MAGKPVAVKGQVTPIPAQDGSGTWTPGGVEYETYDHLTIGGQPVIHGASCTFTFAGTTSKPPDKVVLSASASRLQGGQAHVLVDGDSATGLAGNQLKVITGNKLRSS